MQTFIDRMVKNRVLLSSIENYIQYPVINHKGKEHVKECVYIYIYIYRERERERERETWLSDWTDNRYWYALDNRL